MTKEQEDKIIKQAQDILERRMAVSDDVQLKVNLQNLVYYGAYYMGALATVNRLADYCRHSWRGDEKIYLEAELKLITSSKRAIQLWLDDTPMRYRNHKTNKKGKLESVECYFVEYRNVIQEVK